MGFQSGINQTLGAVAGAAYAFKSAQEAKAKEQEAAEEKKVADAEKQAKATEQGLLAKEQYHEAKADKAKLSYEQEQADAVLKDKNLAKIASGKDSNGKKIMSEQGKFYQSQAISEREAADRAFKELTDRIEAKQAMMSRAQAIMKRTGTWGGMR